MDNYPVADLQRRGILLCHTPGVLTETTADTVFAMLMATSRRLVELAKLVRDGRWTRNIGEDLFGWDVHGKTLGILGFGRIGQAVARRAALGFGMPVLYHDPSGGGRCRSCRAAPCMHRWTNCWRAPISSRRRCR